MHMTDISFIIGDIHKVVNNPKLSMDMFDQNTVAINIFLNSNQ